MYRARRCEECYGTGCVEPDLDECEVCHGEGIVYDDEIPPTSNQLETEK